MIGRRPHPTGLSQSSQGGILVKLVVAHSLYFVARIFICYEIQPVSGSRLRLPQPIPNTWHLPTPLCFVITNGLRFTRVSNRLNSHLL